MFIAGNYQQFEQTISKWGYNLSDPRHPYPMEKPGGSAGATVVAKNLVVLF